MKIFFLTVFPNLVEEIIKNLSITKRALRSKRISFYVVNIRDFTFDKHRQVDDYVYGKGKGMLLKFEPVFRALQFAKRKSSNPYIILPSPRGKVLDKYIISDLSKMDEFIFICPNYEGVDGRILRFINEELSIGDYVISSGELASFVILEAVLRFKYKDQEEPLVEKENLMDDSFCYMGMDFLIEPSQYTRPRKVLVNNYDIEIEEYLYSGNHKVINENLLKEAIETTIYKKPYLYKYFLQNYKDIINKNVLYEAVMNSVVPS